MQLVGGSAILLQRLAVLDAYYLISVGLRATRRNGAEPPVRMRALQQALSLAAEQVRSTSAPGHHDVAPPRGGAGCSTGDEIGTTTAATVLGLSTRQVQRLAADLDGRRVGGRWVFDQAAVHSYRHHRSQPAA